LSGPGYPRLLKATSVGSGIVPKLVITPTKHSEVAAEPGFISHHLPDGPEVRGRPFWSHNVPSVNAEAPDRVQSATPVLLAADSPTEAQVR
jgi:hypothetical protein